MRRILVVIAAAALIGSTLAFTPAVSPQQAETTHQVTFSEDGTATVEGDVAGGVNPTPFVDGTSTCSAEPDQYCETILLTIEQPVADEDPDAIDFGLGEVTIDITAAVPGSDFDLFVFESDADANKGTQVANSGNMAACAQVCGSGAPDPVGLWGNQCEGTDECVEFGVTTSELAGTRHYLVEVVYFASAAGYTGELSYTRTDGRNFDGTTPEPGEPAPPPVEPVDSVEPVDVTGGFEPAGDWGGGGNNAAIGDALGQDFEAAYIEYGDDTFTFTLDMTSLLPAGGTPELTRYGWSFRYNDLELELDGKFTNYSRGTCDPTAGSCPPPRDPGIGSFLLRGDCVEDDSLPMTLTLCQEFANVQATFDPSDGTITIPIPADALAPDGVQGCDEIVGISSFIGNSIWSAPSAFITNTLMPFDDALHYIPFVVPPADPAVTC